MGSKQLGFGDYEQSTAKERSRRERFLAEMESAVPWKALIELAAMRRFAGIALITDRIPDETTILAFRHLLEKHDLGEQIFEAVKAHLKANGMAMKQGTIIEATLIAAPSSSNNKKKERDPEKHQTKKGNQWFHRCAEGFAYGM
jgi:IS5 family transposase